ncbi:MAG TPA: hypothetical protein VFF04_05150 [Candidatus Babeliales bacterium]|nr:hypothetical protein [Candidatus Babeliales bacterium]
MLHPMLIVTMILTFSCGICASESKEAFARSKTPPLKFSKSFHSRAHSLSVKTARTDADEVASINEELTRIMHRMRQLKNMDALKSLSAKVKQLSDVVQGNDDSTSPLTSASSPQTANGAPLRRSVSFERTPRSGADDEGDSDTEHTQAEELSPKSRDQQMLNGSISSLSAVLANLTALNQRKESATHQELLQSLHGINKVVHDEIASMLSIQAESAEKKEGRQS